MRRALPYLSLMMLASACESAKTPVRAAAADLAATHDLAPVGPPKATFVPSDIPRIDVHTHIEVGALQKAVALLGAHHIVHLVNLSGGSPGGDGLEETLAEARQVGHTTVFVNPDFREAKKGPGYGARMAAKIKQGHALGARGVKIAKGLGLGHVDARRQLLAVDDPGLDPVFEMAGKLGMPIAIHTGDPKAFWKPPTPDNERFDELRVHPGWSFFGAPVTWEALYAQFERRVARHPKTTFIGVHFGNDPEDPAHVAMMLERHKNLMIDTAARLPEIGRVDANHDAVRMRAFFEKYRTRILFGTDVGVGNADEDLMLGSTGATPPGPAEVERFFTSTWRWFETNDKQIPSPTPIQGRWNIDGVGLEREVLEAVYHGNAEKLLGVKLPSTAAAP
jgi:predicted TIM-barrel fold metal-dependent hydrolase